MVELERIARALDVEDTILEQMRRAELELTIHLPASRSDGTAANISALQCLLLAFLRLRHGTCHGPAVFLNQCHARQHSPTT